MKLGTFRPKIVAETDLGRNVPLPVAVHRIFKYDINKDKVRIDFSVDPITGYESTCTCIESSLFHIQETTG